MKNPQVLMLLDCASVGHHSYYASGACDFDDLSNGYVSILQSATRDIIVYPYLLMPTQQHTHRLSTAIAAQRSRVYLRETSSLR